MTGSVAAGGDWGPFYACQEKAIRLFQRIVDGWPQRPSVPPNESPSAIERGRD